MHFVHYLIWVRIFAGRGSPAGSPSRYRAQADVSARTLIRLEQGDPVVGIGNLAAVMAALGSPEGLADQMSLENDPVDLIRLRPNIRHSD